MTKYYISEEANIGLQLPDGWTVSHNENFPLIVLAPKEDSFRANMTFSIRELKPPTQENFEQKIATARADREQDYKGFDLLSEEKWMQEDFPAYSEVYHWNADQDNTPLTQIFALIMTGPDALYSVHGTTLRSLEASYIPHFKAILKSLTFYE